VLELFVRELSMSDDDLLMVHGLIVADVHVFLILIMRIVRAYDYWGWCFSYWYCYCCSKSVFVFLFMHKIVSFYLLFLVNLFNFHFSIFNI